MFTSFHAIYSFITKAFVMVFGVSFTVLCCLPVYFFFENPLWYIPFVFFGIITSILIGSYIDVLLAIPFKLPKAFDPMKNKVALGAYANLQEFQEEVADFMLTFFNYLGADVIGGKFHFKGCEPTIKECNVDFNQFSPETFKHAKKRLSTQQVAFHLPIKLGNENLGYMIIITSGYTIPIFYSILKDFENFYLDDQIKHFVK